MSFSIELSEFTSVNNLVLIKILVNNIINIVAIMYGFSLTYLILTSLLVTYYLRLFAIKSTTFTIEYLHGMVLLQIIDLIPAFLNFSSAFPRSSIAKRPA